MGDAVKRKNIEDNHSWPSRMLSFLGFMQLETKNDSHSWADRILKKYGSFDEAVKYYRRKRALDDEERLMKVWDGVMLDDAKIERCKSFEEIDLMVDELLSKGYRIVKSSAITPKGCNYHEIVPNAHNLFFEQVFDGEEFKALYDYFGRYHNNFPIYNDFGEYVKTHDIWVVEEINTGRPIAFSTYAFINDKETRDLYGTLDEQKLLYHDTVVLDPMLQGKGIGMAIMDIMDAYYLQTFGYDNINFALCTGEINTNDKGITSIGFHEKRGFGRWKEAEAPLKKWVMRYNDGIAKEYSSKRPEKPKMMRKSYLYAIEDQRR